MKMKVLFFTLILASSMSNADTMIWEKVGSDYTSLKNCKQIPTDEDDIYEAICPAKKPYKLKEFATQDGSGIAVVYGEKEIGHHLSSPPPRYIKGDKVEWRFHYKNGKKIYHALIHRMSVATVDDEGDIIDRQVLDVIRLDKDYSCVIGEIKQGKNMNIKARQLADMKDAPCMDN